ncbi:hypothetical protein [Paracoccus cavernae]|uniref:hypothetical protein n=1 Tax=Paracoccus cavernae TaxID=1571207 RepID=UPI003645C652
MLYPLRDRILGLVFACLAATPSLAENRTDMGGALAAAGRRDWVAAEAAAARSGPVAQSLIAWQKLRAGQGAGPNTAISPPPIPIFRGWSCSTPVAMRC